METIEILFDGEYYNVYFNANLDFMYDSTCIESCKNESGDEIWNELTSHEQKEIFKKVKNDYLSRYERD